MEHGKKVMFPHFRRLTTKLQEHFALAYSDPDKGFDGDWVKGMVTKLAQVQNPKHSEAAKVVAEGRLYQALVDDVVTGKALLDGGM
mmetsp:Transcript_27410/g.56101  ORF Transcript_27410/g.56101 Transcript_27410/m.56101 type:complete len:86 (+) Transcript_27410:640-897(+)